MDRFKAPDDAEVEEFSTCANPDCRATIHKGDSYLLHYGYVCCVDLKCLMKITETEERTAEDDE